jgi:hypothetical protein
MHQVRNWDSSVSQASRLAPTRKAGTPFTYVQIPSTRPDPPQPGLSAIGSQASRLAAERKAGRLPTFQNVISGTGH